MRIDDELQRARYGYDRLSEDSGVDYGYLRQLTTGKQGAGERTLAALARGLLRHAHRLLWLAARFLSAAGEREAAERVRAHAQDLWGKELGEADEPTEELPPPDAESPIPRAARRGRRDRG